MNDAGAAICMVLPDISRHADPEKTARSLTDVGAPLPTVKVADPLVDVALADTVIDVALFTETIVVPTGRTEETIDIPAANPTVLGDILVMVGEELVDDPI